MKLQSSGPVALLTSTIHSLLLRTLKMKVLVTQLYLTLLEPMDYSPPGSSVHEILQAGILEWVAIPFPRGSSQPRSPSSQADSLLSEPSGKSKTLYLFYSHMDLQLLLLWLLPLPLLPSISRPWTFSGFCPQPSSSLLTPTIPRHPPLSQWQLWPQAYLPRLHHQPFPLSQGQDLYPHHPMAILQDTIDDHLPSTIKRELASRLCSNSS